MLAVALSFTQLRNAQWNLKISDAVKIHKVQIPLQHLLSGVWLGVESNWNSFDSKICDSIDSKGQKIFEKFDEN